MEHSENYNFSVRLSPNRFSVWVFFLNILFYEVRFCSEIGRNYLLEEIEICQVCSEDHFVFVFEISDNLAIIKNKLFKILNLSINCTALFNGEHLETSQN